MVTAILVPVLIGVPLGPSAAAPTWAPASSATIRPGVQTFTDGSQCTANFVYHDATDVYIGQAAHCSPKWEEAEGDACAPPSLPLGTPVTVEGASRPGTMVYNSWLTMRQRGESDRDACQYNDLALVRLDPADAGRVNPTVPHWGGPAGINTSGTAFGEAVYSYGNSELLLGLDILSPRRGFSHGDTGGGWSHLVTVLTPGIPGDSGSAFLDRSGRALGVLSTLGVAVPGGVVNGVGDLGRALDYLRSHSQFKHLQLASGTERFEPDRLPLRLGS